MYEAMSFSWERFLFVIVYAIAIGVLIKTLAWIVRRVCKVETRPKEAALLAGAVIGFLVAFGFALGHLYSVIVTALILVGYFVSKIVARKRA